MHQIHNSVHTFYIYLAITHREKNNAMALSYQQTIRSFRQCVQQLTLCVASYRRAHSLIHLRSYTQKCNPRTHFCRCKIKLKQSTDFVPTEA